MSGRLDLRTEWTTTAKEAVESHDEGMKAARASLPPKDGAGWRRLGIGYGVVGCVFALGLILAFGGRGKQSSNPMVAGAVIVDLAAPTPLW